MKQFAICLGVVTAFAALTAFMVSVTTPKPLPVRARRVTRNGKANWQREGF